MKEISLVVLGWILGLLSPLIVDGIKDKKRLRSVAEALRIELEDLQFRLTVSSLYLLQRHGTLDAEFLAWVKPIVDRYSGNEPSGAIKELIEKMSADDGLKSVAADFFRAKPGFGSSIKTYQASFLESHLEIVARLPIEMQRKIHEFRNQLSILNQDIVSIEPRVLMTFNPSLGSENASRLTQDLDNRSIFIQQRCRSVADRIGSILKGM